MLCPKFSLGENHTRSSLPQMQTLLSGEKEGVKMLISERGQGNEVASELTSTTRRVQGLTWAQNAGAHPRVGKAGGRVVAPGVSRRRRRRRRRKRDQGYQDRRDSSRSFHHARDSYTYVGDGREGRDEKGETISLWLSQSPSTCSIERLAA